MKPAVDVAKPGGFPIIPAYVQADFAQPGEFGSVSAKIVQVPVGFQEGVLHRVGGVRLAAQHPQRDIIATMEVLTTK